MTDLRVKNVSAPSKLRKQLVGSPTAAGSGQATRRTSSIESFRLPDGGDKGGFDDCADSWDRVSQRASSFPFIQQANFASKAGYLHMLVSYLTHMAVTV